MEAFREGRLHVLVGTTVVEVGVHVPNATMMIIQHPERFGLAQLHQLRGRVGRGRKRGACLLMLRKGLPAKTLARLKILEKNHDGFEIARKDLALRGQGELTGTRQAGMGELDFGEVLAQPDLLFCARDEARRLVDSDPGLSRPRHSLLREAADALLARPSDL
jgi:ATP-dependent DNA helicase RecG